MSKKKTFYTDSTFYVSLLFLSSMIPFHHFSPAVKVTLLAIMTSHPPKVSFPSAPKTGVVILASDLLQIKFMKLNMAEGNADYMAGEIHFTAIRDNGQDRKDRGLDLAWCNVSFGRGNSILFGRFGTVG